MWPIIKKKVFLKKANSKMAHVLNLANKDYKLIIMNMFEE